MSNPQLREGELFTYGDYLTWPEEERWELIEGVPYDMTPAPLTRHQAISGALYLAIGNALKGKPCRLFAAPFDVRLPEADEPDEKVRSIVQPDIAVICDPKKLDRRGCRGAPDFVLEILSPSTAAKDQIQKVALYEKHGVREYWILHPTDRMLTIHRLEVGRFVTSGMMEARGTVPVRVLGDLEVDLDAVFESVAGLEI